ncbi:6-phosphogluconolactonase [Flavobacterium johnsoniae]|uniref:6-phosphogluconolactonase n=1 Tax=Flavobacterium johnsoniae (strain ATCC 17061 / DSM 2064 / JCM 8514 / BCRC 14874 / CCUG 350202 / NBRC 14942 / NCIMB 11054 / UW101) TaxID=376686 RepID=A5FAH5_FLAJ1|nr:6-phosphogluconolactonase [Flavobacterium johnsoniae]ABQ07800.1 6-phosphogluconolactonase [Flavobacterium johnsoniae UW101]OXG01882.1 6-phosphogluconolactonase [Flavobacterium johnsoniae UW101]WQG80357.1 6-phosphogluconolactonase [Flavobacterium johnsoniae UW101]SHL01491.1 6-phosphogluconolactonase [Flavobacterium johnsoniae]
MIQIYNTTEEINTAAADLFTAAAQDAIAKRGKFTAVLTGGSSPSGIYKLLASDAYKNKIDWSKVYIFWGDERWVPLNDDLSNAKMSYAALLSHVPIPSENIFEMYKDGVTPEDYAVTYEQSIRKILGEEGKFDFIFLGMGDDGHTASLFPGEAVLNEQNKWVDAYFLAPQNMHRITLTAPLINKAEKIIVVTFGEKKAHALKEVTKGEYNPSLYPTQLIKPVSGELVFLVDKSAAGTN